MSEHLEIDLRWIVLYVLIAAALIGVMAVVTPAWGLGIDVPENVKAAAVSECVQSAAVAGAIASEAINERHDSADKFIATINNQFRNDEETRNFILRIGELVYAQPPEALKSPVQFARKFRSACLESMRAQFAKQFGTPPAEKVTKSR